jgi:hypothetical protein
LLYLLRADESALVSWSAAFDCCESAECTAPTLMAALCFALCVVCICNSSVNCY